MKTLKITIKFEIILVYFYQILAKQPPWAAFPSPSGGAGDGGGKMVLKPPQSHGDFEYMLSFEIGQGKSSFYSEQQTDKPTQYGIST